MAEITGEPAVLRDVARTARDAQATRRWLEAELSALLPMTAVDAVTSAVGEFLIVACLPQHPATVTVRVVSAEITIEVRCRANGTPELGELAHGVLAATVDRWGVSVHADEARLWARLDLL